MDISKCSAKLLGGSLTTRQLPIEILDSLRHGSNSHYLDTLSQLALNPSYTTTIFLTHRPVLVDLCSRWLSFSKNDDVSALAVLAKILPSAPYLSPYAQCLLDRRRGTLGALASREATALLDLPTESLGTLLLALCRLLMFDDEAFATSISPAQLQVLLTRPQKHIRYLAIKILCLYLHASDAALTTMIKSYVGEDEIPGLWDGKEIDYTFFSLWEKSRLKGLRQLLKQSKNDHEADGPENVAKLERVLQREDFSPQTALIAGTLIPRVYGTEPGTSSLVMTKTATNNSRAFADAVRSSKPILVTGCFGVGKTSIIKDVARVLGKHSAMVTLHLNAQSDTKLLIGMYTSANTPGSFSWSPGVLTKAVSEGRWLVIEGLDRAPTEIVSTLLSLLERSELFVPNWGKSIRAAPGFKLIATVRSKMNASGEEVMPTTSMIGARHWLQVPFKLASDEELSKIIINRFPLLEAYIPSFINVYQSIGHAGSVGASGPSTESIVPKSHGPQELLKWCGRVQDLLLSKGIVSGNEAISVTLSDHIFLEAVDCFAGAYASGSQKAKVIDLIAQALHIPAVRVGHCLNNRKPVYRAADSELAVGRVTLSKRRVIHCTRSVRSGHSPFATTNGVIRTLESIAVAVKQAEPCLLVGETGTGKTTVVQQLADLLNYKLTVVNLSQQSEAGDLLGGYKPVTIRALAIPMKDEFDELLELTFTSKQNQRFLEALGKSISKSRWARTLTLWQEALRIVARALQSKTQSIDTTDQEHQIKKRKVQSSKLQKLKSRWDRFESDVQTFQKHLASGSQGVAFSFIEGNIIKAARNGEWVLLDEINLASPDTLDSLADLFSHKIDGGPSILLTESGDTERVQAHKDFRIFGAMNPATDIGKRDLPLDLRSKFTELYLEAPDNDLANLVPVVEVYLGDHCHRDVRAANDVAQLYLEIKKLANGNQLVDGSKQKPHFSLRTLTRTLVYVVDIVPLYGFRRALFEGFSMSFLTSLDKESKLLIQPLIDRYIIAGQKNVRALLHQTPQKPQDGREYKPFRHYWILQGAAPVEEQSHYIITPFIERNLLNLVRATSTRRFPVLLQGPTSSGKTSMVEYLARISGNKFVRINNHEHTDLQEYLGFYVSGPDGRLEYQEGVLVQAIRQGYWVVLDELNLAPTDVLEALNRLLDNNRELFIPETQQSVTPHKDFMLFATQNPAGMYGGRKVLSRAFRNRFLELHFGDIPEDELETILRDRSQIAPSFCKKIVCVYKELSTRRYRDRLFEQKNGFATLRDLFRWASRKADFKEQLAINGFLLLAERVRNPEERSVVKKVIEDVMKVPIDESKLYNSARTQGTSPLGIVWTQSMRRLHVLVTEALKNDEPVLLIGGTGCGKTTICQLIAEMTGTKLHIVNAHQNMETGDLIGAQRPIRNRAHAELQLAQNLRTVLEACDTFDENLINNIPALLEKYDILQRAVPAALTDEMRLCVETSKRRVNAMFEWTDGSLVRAMHHGQLFLLDEISLADDSVIERLNSVLEPSRVLFLAEKGTADSLVEATPGFQFLATMNPGGDYGKRELSPALRNRFTEIWVPNVSSSEEMLEIVQAKLNPQKSHFAKSMVMFAAWYSTTYTATASSISIRDLLSWTQFVNVFQGPDPRHGLLHGAAMVYIDNLGANPASKLSFPDSDLSTHRRRCLSKLDEAFGMNLSSIYYQEHQLWNTDESLGIGPFALVKACGSRSDTRYSLQAPTTKANAMKIARALLIGKPILVEGSPGVGKTTLVAALAQAIGMPLTRLNLSDQTDLMDLFGSDVPIEGADAGKFMWRDAPFLRAMQRGEWVLLDEMNLATQSVLEGLNACFDHRGQVHVSELDHTFDKHPNFVVFAAQNPHHQGGGRKGLPASFVDRFTVVYADNLSSEDLMIVSSDVFPGISGDTIAKVLHSVSTLSHTLQLDTSVGAYGGPWEINLRDVLRWLHLLTMNKGMLPLARPADFQRLLFLQRFRRYEDVTIVTKVLQGCIPQDQAFTSFHGRCAGMLEIGLGVLPRNLSFHSTSLSPLQDWRMNLDVAESVMLCIQNRWPCLLVGESGSGKSSLIFQLASLIGADVVEISLNSEMDTLDLLGGYEQVDPQRAVADFVGKLQDMARTDLISNLLRKDEQYVSLGALESILRQPAVPLCEVLKIIRAVALETGSSRYADLVVECENFLAVTKDKNRARFEWVDGILVKAVQQGKWVILDNANLCNPSVLDRLNSLLEPNGFLSINEHRNADGSAHMIRPHTDFRLFMTMDPRYGELSRAMRNRSIELFMSSQSVASQINILGSDCESFLSRFEWFQAFEWSKMSDVHFGHVVSICFDHLTYLDLNICRRWEAQIKECLIDLTPSKQMILAKIAKIYRLMSESERPVSQAILETYKQLGSKVVGDGSSFESVQTIQPYNNPILLSATDANPSSSNLRRLGSRLELSIEVCVFMQDLVDLDGRLELANRTIWSPLERSMICQRNGKFQSDATQPLAVFLRDVGSRMLSFLEAKDMDNVEDLQHDILIFWKILHYLRDIFDLTLSENFDEDIFQAYQSIGRSLCSQASSWAGVRGDIASELNAKLDTFNLSWQLSSGLGLDILWRALKPNTPRNLRQLELNLMVKGLADRFDAVKWKSGASVRELKDLQSSMTRLHTNVEACSSLDLSPLDDIQTTLKDLETHAALSQTEISPHFASEFEMLSQYAAPRSPSTSRPCSSITLLAGRPTAESMNSGASSEASVLLSNLDQITAMGHPIAELGACRAVLPVSLLQRLEDASNVPLRSLDMLCTEMGLIARELATNMKAIQTKPLEHLYRTLRALRNEMQQALGLQAGDNAVRETQLQLGLLLHQSGAKLHDERSMRKKSQHLHLCLAESINPRIFEAPKAPNKYFQGFLGAAYECVQFFTGCLLLYVPNRRFDPALRPTVDRVRHNKRKAELLSKLQALREFEQVFAGQTSNYRVQRVEQSLESLGAEPEVPPVVRPVISQLGQLQAELNNILSTIVLRSPDSTTLRSVHESQSSQLRELNLLRANIAQAVLRLSRGFHAYDDITAPLIAMLRGLDAGLALAFVAGGEDNSDEDIKYLCDTTPLLGGSPQFLEKISFPNSKKKDSNQVDYRLNYLNRIATAQSVSHDLDATAANTMSQAFQSLYEDWRGQLGRDQQRNTASSSLYRYRGSEEDNDEATKQDFENLFPDYYRPSKDDIKRVVDSEPDPRGQARSVAQVHRDIFLHAQTPSEALLGLLRNTSDEISRLKQCQSGISTSLPNPAKFLPALVLHVHEARERLLGKTKQRSLYNFYTDANIDEAQSLIAFVHKTRVRFNELLDVWPEHATLGEVLKTSSELLALRHTEPIAKLLTKTEQLHGYVHEWEAVASKEYTVVDLCNQVKDLIVSWRRLELENWKRLLDMEDQKCSDDADAWWFMAYEIIIAAPLSMIHDGKDVCRHTEQLYSTLADFLTTTPMGQYAHRLGIIDCFKGHLHVLAKDVPPMQVVHNAITNFVKYYAHFQPSVRDALRKGRQPLERDMKEIFLLASWKDTNINALRDSARRSHHKLFKVVRQHRMQLAQSVDMIVGQGLPEQAELFAPSAVNVKAAEPVDPRALQICQQYLPRWQAKHERFSNPNSTILRMISMSSPIFVATDPALYLDAYGAKLIESIKDLQNETPTKATKDNGSIIRHLKARKRRLLADTLKSLRQMGCRSNMSTNALTKQASTAAILTRSPAIDGSLFKDDTIAADYHFHKLLSLLTQAREKGHTHSEDLTHGEVSRSLGYLESVLSVILKQREVLATTVNGLCSFGDTIRTLKALYEPDCYTLQQQDYVKAISVSKISSSLKWLPSILEAASVIVEKQNDLDGTRAKGVTQMLERWKAQIAASAEVIEALPERSLGVIGLASSRSIDLLTEVGASLRSLKTDLRDLKATHPASRYILQQIELWVDLDDGTHEQGQNGTHIHDLNAIDTAITGVVDSVLVTIQQVQTHVADLPRPGDLAWMKTTDLAQESTLKNLHITEVDKRLNDALLMICQLDPTEQSNLSVAGAICAMALPIFEQYHSIHLAALHRHLRFHRSLCRLASTLAQSFLRIALDGFCSPAETSATETGKSEKLEEGTGLGDGEGAEDISKDMQDDEDLSELAQKRNEDEKREELDNQEDAVDMDHDEMEGEFGEGPDKEDGDGSASESGSAVDNLDEEVGNVDDLDPTAVDEKLWDGKAGDEDKEKEGQKPRGETQKDEKMAAESAAPHAEEAEQHDEDGKETNNECAEEGEAVAKEEVETLDPRTQEGQNLDLPEEMDLDDMSGSESGSESGLSSMDGMSDTEHEPEQGSEDKEAQDDVSEQAREASPIQPEGNQDVDGEIADTDIARSPVDTEPSDDGEDEADEQSLLRDQTDDAAVDTENAVPSDAQGLSGDNDQEQDEEASGNQAQAGSGTKGNASDQDQADPAGENSGLASSKNRSEAGQMQDEPQDESEANPAIKKLGNALEEWHRQNSQIKEAAEQEEKAQPEKSDIDMADPEFEHLQGDDAAGDTQALGAATNEEARALDEEAMDSEMRGETHDFPRDQAMEEAAMDHNKFVDDALETFIEGSKNQQEQSRPSTFVNNTSDLSRRPDHIKPANSQENDDMEILDQDFSTTHIQNTQTVSARSPEESYHLWSHYEGLTRDLSLLLTEQLRLILAPTLATKMRGDFRTGKRLNIKRIIPYIASQYKRDKIWMRRSIPSKRSYQIMLAVDDSKSMGESGSGQLAFETLALVTKSLSMLEVGEICVVGFGEDVHVAHAFDKPFLSEAGAQIYQHFGFQQTKTNVRKLVAESVGLFREARRKNIYAGTDLWQLQLIVSDGVCEDHDSIRRLVRQAQEERIMIVFVIVDAMAKGESIMDMKQAIFSDTGFQMKRYLDGFPFPYYVVVGNVRELPGVLAQALRQWFSEVVESG